MIYELIFYWDDLCDGSDITQTILTHSYERVKAEIEDFKNQQIESGGEEIEFNKNHYIFGYSNQHLNGFFNLKIIEHDKID